MNVMICEMAPRDGLQVLNRSATIPLADRVALIETLERAELPYIEVGAFVSPKRIPAMADTTELLGCLKPYDGQLAALVPNLSYFEQFAAAENANTVALFVSASESYSQKNTRMSVGEALEAAVQVAAAAGKGGYGLRAHISGAFRDLTEDNGPSETDVVMRVCERLREVDDHMVLALADTDGNAVADDVDRVIDRVHKSITLDNVGVHLHDRDGAGITNALRAFEAGVRIFDAAVGGIGGNPTALENPVGNVATEELIEALEAAGARVDVDMKEILEAGRLIWTMAEHVGDPHPPSRLLAEHMGQ